MHERGDDSGKRERSVAELLAGYAEILADLRGRGVIRSANAPTGDYAEWLVARALGGTLAKTFSEKSWDLLLPSGEKLQVKSRLVSDPPTASQLGTSPFRSWDFDLAALVLLRGNDYGVHQAALVPMEAVKAAARRVEHINGWTVRVTTTLLAGGRDITEDLRSAAETA